MIPVETERKRSLRSHREPVIVNEPSCSVAAQPAPAVPNNGISKLTIRNLGTLGKKISVEMLFYCT